MGVVAYGVVSVSVNMTAAITGTDPLSGQQLSTDERIDLAARGIGQLAGGGLGARGYGVGREFKMPFGIWDGPTGKPGRIAPWGNRTGTDWGEFPHYHRAIPDPNNPGNSCPGQGMRNHRPWEGGF